MLELHQVALSLSRSTAFGIHSGIGRVGAILGNVMFGHLLDVDRSIPILIVASLLATGAVCAVFLPPIYRPENRPPLVRFLYRMKRKFCCGSNVSLWKKQFSIAKQQSNHVDKSNNCRSNTFDENGSAIATTTLSCE